MEYAKDAMETDKPWERWEFYHRIEKCWKQFKFDHPAWNFEDQYRRKAQTINININGYEVPEPYRGEMKIGQRYYIPRLGCGSKYDIVTWAQVITWDNNEHDNGYKFKGLLHLTELAAIKHTEALLSLTQL
jgi:hypothetical protein